ncbi:hypothetical protein B0T24DRAFT_606079 [Lasiosphaeria ovina]|uniref:Uncharacterized protein n=1 Tax=Lasiosphaeria ovina TaxID=92902 RepID=A0AAE0NLG7_9PEZI|nr:hypothetical protein B0T24DRAFT_606079 [Lasiosphaeria ovina]
MMIICIYVSLLRECLTSIHLYTWIFTQFVYSNRPPGTATSKTAITCSSLLPYPVLRTSFDHQQSCHLDPSSSRYLCLSISPP